METIPKSVTLQDVSKTVASVLSYGPEVSTIPMKYGSSAEIFAKMRLMQILKKDHKKVDIIRDPGLHVCASCEEPFNAASPYISFTCTCHGRCVAEIKCPYTVRTEKPTADNVNCLETVDNCTVLKKSHPYYSQIQGQYFCCNVKTGFLFVYSSDGELMVFVERVDSTIARLVQNLKEFYMEYVAPALLTEYIKKRVEEEKKKQPTSCKVADATQQRLRTGQPRVQSLHDGFYLCGVCTQVCKGNPHTSDENSVSHSECQLWFHTLCVNEPSDNDTFWMCLWGTDMET